MPRPNNKKSLIILSKDTFASLLDLVYTIPSNASVDINDRDRDMHYIMAHLYNKIWEKYQNLTSTTSIHYNCGIKTLKKLKTIILTKQSDQ